VSMERATREERENKMLVAQPDQQGEVTGSSMGGIQVPGHNFCKGKPVTRDIRTCPQVPVALSPLRFQNLHEEIGDGIITSDPVGVFEDIVPFIFEKQDADILAFLF
jgi:hypothetical protein